MDYTVGYDTLIVAAGASQSYFGNDQFADFAPGMKSIDDALELRARIFGAFELADLQTDPETIDRWLTFVVVGAGPTGVEMAGQIAELAHRTLPGQYKRIDPRKARVILVDAIGRGAQHVRRPPVHPRAAPAAPARRRGGAGDQGGRRGRRPASRWRPSAGRQRIPSMTKMWAAGVAAPPLSRQLAEVDRRGDRPGRPDQGEPGPAPLPGHPEIFAVGDMMALDQLPGVAQVAIQGGRYAAGQIKRRLAGQETGRPFQYLDKGSMATISRFSAVASVGKLHFSGFLGWLLWLAVHLLYLVGFKNRLTAVLHWAVSFLGRGRSERVATFQQAFARTAFREFGDPFERVSRPARVSLIAPSENRAHIVVPGRQRCQG